MHFVEFRKGKVLATFWFSNRKEITNIHFYVASLVGVTFRSSPVTWTGASKVKV